MFLTKVDMAKLTLSRVINFDLSSYRHVHSCIISGGKFRMLSSLQDKRMLNKKTFLTPNCDQSTISNNFLSDVKTTSCSYFNSVSSNSFSRWYHLQSKFSSFRKYCQNSYPYSSSMWTANYSTKTVNFNSNLLKNQSALLVKRSQRKKIPKIHDEGKTRQLNNVVAYALGEEIKLTPLKTILMKQGLYAFGELPPDVSDSLHVRGKYNVEQKPKEIFIFDDGSVVFWCVPEVERGAFLKVLMKYCGAPYPVPLVLAEREELDFTFVKGQTAVLDDVIQLKERQSEESNMDNMLELYAFSNAMAQSVKLSMWEASLEKFIISIEPVTEDVREGKKISMSRRKLLMKSGELMSLRHLINLSSDLLDTPDFYWDRSHLEPLYQSLCSHLSVAKRTKVINEKLTHCCELVDLVRSHLSDEHHIRLELMIIILILVEVAIEAVHFLKDYLESRPEKELSSSEEISDVSSKNK